MDLQFFNTLTRRIETFKPMHPEKSPAPVSMYCCGPTVYDYAHIGNFRTFVFSDMVRRFLEFKGFAVTHVMNITDVDDKIIKRVNSSNPPQTLSQYTATYEQAFFQDFDALNCKRPTHNPHATKYIRQMLELIGKLMANGIAYQTPDGSVFFSIQKYIALGGKYGQLVNINFDQARIGERVQNDEYDKENAADFALWKARVPADGDVWWDSPWGQGRPGWHIECSAMSSELLGPTFDIHVGGEDLAFPHHEDEIAQSEGCTLTPDGKTCPTPFVRYWIHFSHLLSEGKKMSKSLGNFYTLRDLFKKGFTGREIRYLLLSAHYRESLNFTLEGLNGARSALSRIDELLRKLKETAANDNTSDKNETVLQAFDNAMSDNFNLSEAWAVVFDWVRECNKLIAQGNLTASGAKKELNTWDSINTVLGIQPAQIVEEIPAELQALLEQRQTARKAKDFAKADAIRDQLKALGWVIEDTPKGARLKSIGNKA